MARVALIAHGLSESGAALIIRVLLPSYSMPSYSIIAMMLPVLGVAAAASSWNATLAKEAMKLLTTPGPQSRSHVPLQVVGTLPPWLSGRYYRNGPGLFYVNHSDPNSQHVNGLFDGYSQLNAFELAGGKNTVHHTAQFVRSPRYESLLQRGDMSYQGKIMMGTTPHRRENLINVFNMGGEVNVNLLSLGQGGGRTASNLSHLLAVGELPFGMEVDPSTLTTRVGTDKHAFFKYDDDVGEMGVGNAHPIVTSVGDIYTKLSIIPLLDPLRTHYQVVRIRSGTATREVLGTYSRNDGGITYAHSFAMPSERYAILPFWPLEIGKTILAHRNLIDVMTWKGEKGTKMVVLDLHTGASTSFVCDSTFYAFHFVNSYTSNSTGSLELVADVITYKDAALFEALNVEKWRNGTAVDHTLGGGVLQRVVIPIGAAEAEAAEAEMEAGEGGDERGDDGPFSFLGAEPRRRRPERLSSHPALVSTLSNQLGLELPRINDAYTMRPYAYVYATTSTRLNNPANAITKIDVRSGHAALWHCSPNEFACYVGEPVFIPAPKPSAEDDGVVIAVANDVMRRQAFFLVLNASTMTEMSRAWVGTHLPVGFHTQFISA
jgi:carotenoid cleavage dioxygenase-like enzyme